MIIECIERMAVAWFIRAMIEIFFVLLVVSMIVIALLVIFAGNDVNERSRGYEVSEVRKEGKDTDDRHPDNPG